MPTAPRPINSAQHPNRLGISQSLSRSWQAPPIAQYSLAQDIEACSDTEEDWDSEDESDEDEEMQDAPQLVNGPKEKPVPKVDEEGFTEVISKKRR